MCALSLIMQLNELQYILIGIYFLHLKVPITILDIIAICFTQVEIKILYMIEQKLISMIQGIQVDWIKCHLV